MIIPSFIIIMAKGKKTPKAPQTVLDKLAQSAKDLIKCYEKIDPKKALKMGDAEKANLCSEQKATVKAMFQGNELVMSNILSEQIEAKKIL